MLAIPQSKFYRYYGALSKDLSTIPRPRIIFLRQSWHLNNPFPSEEMCSDCSVQGGAFQTSQEDGKSRPALSHVTSALLPSFSFFFFFLRAQEVPVRDKIAMHMHWEGVRQFLHTEQRRVQPPTHLANVKRWRPSPVRFGITVVAGRSEFNVLSRLTRR